MPWEFVLEPGELLLTPAESPHQVENIEQAVSIAGKWVDEVNWEAALGKFRNASLAQEFVGGSVVANIVKAVEEGWHPERQGGSGGERASVPWAEFKRAAR